MISPRPYQREAVDAIYQSWTEGVKNGLVVIPTGGGKALILAMLIKEIQEQWPGTRMLVLTHVKELVEQDYAETLGYYPECRAGIFAASLGRKELFTPVIFASIQSIEKHVHKISPPPEIVIIDEAHLIPREASTRYAKALSTLGAMYPHLKTIGLTATPYRLSTGWLHKGEGALFDKIVYNLEVQTLIDDGYLSPVVARPGAVSIDLSDVHKRGGEYIASELQEAATKGDTTSLAVADFVSRGVLRNKWLIFCTGIKHAEQVKDELDALGISSACVFGSTPLAERTRIIEDYRADKIRALINVDVLTTGFNVPAIDLLIMLRPTESAGLYVQMIGRGMRRHPGKTDCLVLDYAGVTLRHGPIDAVDPDRKIGKGEGVAPSKLCPTCGTFIAAGFRECPYCGHEFPAPEKKITHKPTEAPILKSQIKPRVYDVLTQKLFVHRKVGKADSVRIEYDTGLVSFAEWIFPASTTPAASFYYSQFCKVAGIDWPYPRTAEDFVKLEFKGPAQIEVIKDGKYDRVSKRVYTV